MKRIALLLAILAAPAPLTAQAPDFTGSFSMPGQNGTVVLTLKPAGNGQYTGTMANGSLTWQLTGDIYENALTGMVNTGQGTLAFEAQLAGAQLEFILVEIGPDGLPLIEQGQQFTFTRMAGAQNAQGAANALPFPRPGQAAAQPADPFVGRFTNGELTLTLSGAGDSYTGQLALGAEAFPVTAQRNGDRVEGMMNAPTGQYGFVLAASADGIVMSNAGTDYPLQRVVPDQNGASAGAGQPGMQGAAGQTAQVDNSPLAQQWRAHLAGKKVTYMSSYSSNTLGGGGLNTKFVYHLCSDGRFGYSGSDVVSFNLPNVGVQGGGSSGSDTGMWRIITEGQVAGIELRFGNGQTELYRLDMQNGQTFANGDRVYVTPGEVCN